jgi:signal transduction histidine kinase/tetratricopeptide (TPR) repeat protein
LKKKPLPFSYSILLCFVLLLFSQCRQKQPKTEPVAHQVTHLLVKACQSGNMSLDESYRMASQAFHLARQKGNDSLQSEALLVMGRILVLQGKNNESLSCFQQSLDLGHQIGYNKGTGNALLEIGSVYYAWGQYQRSKAFFDEALSLACHKHLPQIEAIARNYIGKYYHTTGEFNQSVNYYQQAIALFRQLGDTLQSSTVLLSLGKTYLNEGNPHQALACYLQAYKGSEQAGDFVTIAEVCNHLGSIYLLLGQANKALEYHHKALGIRTALSIPEGMAKSFNNLGETFLFKNILDSAHFYFRQSLEYCKRTHYKKGTIKALTNLGKTEYLRRHYTEAAGYLAQSLNLSEKAGYKEGIAESSLALGNNNLVQHFHKQAVFYYQHCLDLSLVLNLSELCRDACLGLYKAQINSGDSAKALAYYLRFSDYEKKLLKAENNRQLAELRITFESEKKEKDNQVLRKDNELKEMTIRRKSTLIVFFIVSLSLTFLLCLLIYYRFEHKRRANHQLEKLNNKVVQQNKELEKLNEELGRANREKDKLFSIIAHELRNPLYWFQNLAEMLSRRYLSLPPEKVQKSLEALDESAKNAFHLMDNLLHWSRAKLNRITPRITPQPMKQLVHESVRMYQSILKQKEIQLTIDIPENTCILADPDLFAFIVRNLLSNAIKYTPVHGFIQITCTEKENNEYLITLSDSGIGILPQHIEGLFNPMQNQSSPGLMQEQGTGFGLKLCKEFAELNGGHIWVNSHKDKGTEFSFTVKKG